MRVVNVSKDLYVETLVPCDLTAENFVVNIVSSAADANAMTIDQVADLSTATSTAYVDLIERVDATSVQIIVKRTSAEMTVRLSSLNPEWTSGASRLTTRILSSLADRSVAEPDSVEFSILL